MSAAERTVLERAGAGFGVRLACQLRPIRDIAFARPCFLRTQRWRRSNRSWPAGAGDERYLVVMFVDMPGSTRLAKGRLPFDTVFVINQFLNAVSRAVVAADGSPNQCWRMGCSPYLGSQGFQRKLVGRRSSRLR
jgi:adenylate cyclase